jgi:TetR/AcrR family fatty acid metabolism transcriptional regulator
MTARRERPSAGGTRAVGRQRKLDRILGAAEHLFATQGFVKTTVDEIAATAGVSKGLVYDHYISKEELLSAVWSQQVDAWTQATQSGVKYSPGSLADAIGEVLGVSVRYVRAHPLLRRILAQDPGSFLPHHRDDALEFVRQYRKRLEAVLQHGVKSGELRPHLDVPRTAELVWLIHFTLIHQLFVGFDHGWRPDGDELLRAAIDLVVAGLRAP